jgi:isoquinoline 1-oxidoreductase beta subunit
MSTSIKNIQLSRRKFLSHSAKSVIGLAVAINIPLAGNALAADEKNIAKLTPWLLISPDNTATIYLSQSEMGQGVYTGLPQILADELELDWQQIRVETAYGEEEYKTDLNGYVAQFVGGSLSTSTFYMPLRKSGAAAKHVLLEAAAKRWSVDEAQCYAESGRIKLKNSNKALTYGELAAAASKLPLPEEPKLKSSAEFKFIGKPMHRLDTKAKTNGSAGFGIDVVVPDMLYATAKASPTLNGKIINYNEAEVMKMRGVKALVHVPLNYTFSVPDTIIVVADGYWNAKKAADALKLEVDKGYNKGVSTNSLKKQYAQALTQPGVSARADGNATKALSSAKNQIEAEYEVPYLAHATMEPMTATVSVKDGKATIWAPIQNQSYTHWAMSETLKLPSSAIEINTTFLGGGFGRRATPEFVVQAALASKAVGKPVKLIWSREEDIKQDNYRQAYNAKLIAGLDENGKPSGLKIKIAAQSLFSQIMPDAIVNGVDESSVEGIADMPYEFDDLSVDVVDVSANIPLGWMRSIGRGPNGFFLESFLDEMAHTAKKDPYLFRRNLMKNNIRGRAVLDAAAKAANWGKPLPKGRYQGIAYHPYTGRTLAWTTHAAEVVEVSVSSSGQLHVHKVYCAMDCGTVVNPAQVEAMAQSAIVFGLTAALKGNITFEDGQVQQSNFHDYQLLNLSEMPKVETILVPSDTPPAGTGESAMPPLAPALTNAIFAATGKRIRSLPINPKSLM